MPVEPPQSTSDATPTAATATPTDIAPAAAQTAAAGPPQPRKARNFWRTLGVVVGALVLLLVAAVAALIFVPPTEFLKGELIRAVRQATGRELTIDGPAKFSFFPKLGLELQTVSLSGPPDAVGPDLLRADTLRAEVRPMSLLQGPIEITRIEVAQPVVTLRPEDKELITKASNTPPGASGKPSGGGVAIKEVTIANGSINYVIKQPNPEWRIDQVTATLSGVTGGGEAKANGNLRWREEPVAFNLILSDAGALGRGAVSPMNVSLEAKPLTVKLAGEVSTANSGEVKGHLTASAPSFRDLLRWLDADPGAYAMKGPAVLEGPVAANGQEIRLDRIAMKLEAGEGTLEAQIRQTPSRPQITGNIAWRVLDVEKLIGQTPAVPALALQTRGIRPETTIPSGWDTLASELSALSSAPSLAAATSAAPAKPDSAAWNKQAFNLKPLSSVDLNVTATADTVKYGPVEMHKSRSEIALQDGRLSYTVKEVALDKGRLTGRVDIDSAIKPPRVAVSVSASDVTAESLLEPFVPSRVLSGKTKVDLVLNGRGQNSQEIINSLDGTADVTVEKGEVVGFNLRQALLEWWRGFSFDSKQSTKFDRLTASYGIQKGIMRNVKDLTVTGGEIEISSSGTVALPSRTLEQRVQLKAVPPPVHFPVPLRVGGGWTTPSISWDWLSVFKNPAALGALTSVAPAPGPVPAEVKASIEKVLSGPNASELPEETRRLLQAMIADQ